MKNISTNQNKIMRKKFQLFILSLSFQSSQPKNLLTWKLMKIKKRILNMNYSHGWAEGEKLFLSNLYGKIISYSFLKYCTFLQNWVKKSFVNNSSKINALWGVCSNWKQHGFGTLRAKLLPQHRNQNPSLYLFSF